MRARLEALAAKWEAEAEARSHTADMQTVARAGVYSYCAAQMRALLAEPERVRMEPQPEWCADVLPMQTGVKQWASGMGWHKKQFTAPSPAHRPVCDKEGKWGAKGDWWWEVQS